MIEYLPAIISAIGTIIAAWFSYNQYSKNKLTDLKIEQFKKDEEAKSIRRADNSALEQPQQEGEIDILMPPVDAGEEGPVEGSLADEGEAQHPQGVFFEIVGVEKALHQQETVDGKGQPTHQPQKLVQPHQPGVDGAAAEQAVLQQGRADVIQQHGQAGNAFQGRAAEGKVRAGKCVVLHFVRPHI